MVYVPKTNIKFSLRQALNTDIYMTLDICKFNENYSTSVDKSSKKPEIKIFYKTNSPRVGFLIENKIWKF